MKRFFYAALVLVSLLFAVDSFADSTATVAKGSHSAELVELTDFTGRIIGEAQTARLDKSVTDSIAQLKRVSFALESISETGETSYELFSSEETSLLVVAGESAEAETDGANLLLHVKLGESNKTVIATLKLIPKPN